MLSASSQDCFDLPFDDSIEINLSIVSHCHTGKFSGEMEICLRTIASMLTMVRNFENDFISHVFYKDALSFFEMWLFCTIFGLFSRTGYCAM
jgi:hypothetical protein